MSDDYRKEKLLAAQRILQREGRRDLQMAWCEVELGCRNGSSLPADLRDAYLRLGEVMGSSFRLEGLSDAEAMKLLIDAEAFIRAVLKL